jgi:uncharacterized Fe-S cluster-containing MiaB family protein
MTLDDVCVNKEIAESQRESELKTYLHDKGCKGFYIMGCYQCNGIKPGCQAYLPKKEVDN